MLRRHEEWLDSNLNKYRILLAGDQSIIIEFGNEISEEIHCKVRTLYQQLQENTFGILDIIPTYRSIMITYDSTKISHAYIKRYVKKCLHRGSVDTTHEHILNIPVCYGGEFGPDIATVAQHTGLSVSDIVERHCANKYLIYMLGFMPGFPYLGGMDKALATPRLNEPRLKIEAGSVGIADQQTGIYPLDSPGGWQIIGRTPLKIYDPSREQPIIFKSGDYIRFYPISEMEYHKIMERGGVICCK